MSWTFDKAFLNPSLPVIFTDVCPWGILNPSFPLALTCERCLTEIKRETNRKTSKTHLIREILRDTHKCSGWNEAPDILTLSKDKIFSYLFRMLSHMLQPPRLSDLRGVKKKSLTLGCFGFKVAWTFVERALISLGVLERLVDERWLDFCCPRIWYALNRQMWAKSSQCIKGYSPVLQNTYKLLEKLFKKHSFLYQV